MNSKLVVVLLALLSLLFSACSPFVPVIDVRKVPKEKLQQSYEIRAYTSESGATYPEVLEYLGDITAFSCKHLLTDPPASKGNALTQLRLKAMEMGADGIIDVTYDSNGTDAWGTNCWDSVQTSGVAVKFKR